MIEVFSTNVKNKRAAAGLKKRLQAVFPDADIHFDLDDCDHVLRIERRDAEIAQTIVISLLTNSGFHCTVLNN